MIPQDSDDHYLKRELYALVRSDSKIFEFLQDGSLDGIWYWDFQKTDVEWMSPRFWETFGYAPEEKPHLAAAWQDMIHPDDLADALVRVRAHCEDASVPYDQIVRYRHKQGHTVWVRCRGIAIRDENSGEVTRILGAHTDVSQLKQAEAELADRAERLDNANRELERFAYAASHDLRSPLNSMSSLIELLVKDHGSQLDEKGQKLLSMVERSASRMRAVVNRILEYSKTTQATPEFERVRGAEAAAAVVEDLQSLIEDRGAEVTIAGDFVTEADSTLLRVLIQNLVENGIKYAGDKPARVEVNLSTEEQMAVIRVVDHGPGIEEKHHKTLYESFQRLHRNDEVEGLGLGLSLCTHIVALHKGSLEVASVLGEGSTFTARLSTS